MEVGRRLAQAKLDIAKLVAGSLQLGREPLERSDRPLRERDEVGGPVAVVGRERRRGRAAAGGELGHVTVPLALGPQPLLLPRLQTRGVLDERAQLCEARLGERSVRGQLLVPSPGP